MVGLQRQYLVQTRGSSLVGEKSHQADVSRRFRPKSRASIDQAPGPIAANVAPRVAKIAAIHGSPRPDKTIHNSQIATTIPTTGVHKPMKSRSPAAAATECRTSKGMSDVTFACANAQWSNAAVVTSRCSRRPTPGQPLAKVEKRRCMATPYNSSIQLASKPPRAEYFSPTFGGCEAQ